MESEILIEMGCVLHFFECYGMGAQM